MKAHCKVFVFVCAYRRAAHVYFMCFFESIREKVIQRPVLKSKPLKSPLNVCATLIVASS